MPNFEIYICYKSDAEDWRKQDAVDHFSIEARHIVDAIHKLACNFPARYAGDVYEINIEEIDRKPIETDEPDRIREGGGWKAREGRDIP
jgi:hypothetical protein